jgi:hypothetical protein
VVQDGAAVAEIDPPIVARILRAHRNAEATIYPFLLLGLVYVLAGGGSKTAIPILRSLRLPELLIRYFTCKPNNLAERFHSQFPS